jgi:hypothetical protein
MSDGRGVDRAARREACERQELADLASQTMGIIVWLARPAPSVQPLSTRRSRPLP